MRSGPIVWIPLVISIAVMVWGIREALAISSDRWEAAGSQRRNWILMMVCFGPLAVLLFYGTVRYRLLYPERYREVDGVAPADR